MRSNFVLVLLLFPFLTAIGQHIPAADTQASATPASRAAASATPPSCADAPVSILMEMKGYGSGRMLTDATAVQRPWSALPSREPVYGKKSPFLAGMLSLVVPGAGELYAGSYWLAALFASIEGAAWYFNIDQTNKGDEQTGIYRAYADDHWSVVKYARWLNENAKDFPGGEDAVHIAIDPDESLPPWQRVDWDAMHTTELAVPVFSHKLPPHGDQQYYELIGKYNQYSYGWDDKLSGDYWNPSQNFVYYSGLRGEANDYYNTADTILNLIIINHVLSAVDAAWAAARFNKFAELYARSHLERTPAGQLDIRTTAQLSFRF